MRNLRVDDEAVKFTEHLPAQTSNSNHPVAITSSKIRPLIDELVSLIPDLQRAASMIGMQTVKLRRRFVKFLQLRTGH